MRFGWTAQSLALKRPTAGRDGICTAVQIQVETVLKAHLRHWKGRGARYYSVLPRPPRWL